MTTGESTDKIEKIDNLTITSDAAYERVSSDEHFEDERGEGFLKQNTSGLVQEIPNISILDIGDFLIENKKTLYDRQNWNIVVGRAGRSIEAQPQDIARLTYDDDHTYSPGVTDYTIPFDLMEIPSGVSESNITTFEFINGHIRILIPGVYKVSYGWTVNTANAKDFQIGLYKNDMYYITSDRYSQSTALGYSRLSGGRTISVKCDVGDELSLYISTDDAGTTVYGWEDTYLEVQYAQQISLNNN